MALGPCPQKGKTWGPRWAASSSSELGWSRRDASPAWDSRLPGSPAGADQG